jgi:hypothetical protein
VAGLEPLATWNGAWLTAAQAGLTCCDWEHEHEAPVHVWTQLPVWIVRSSVEEVSIV